MTTKNIGKQKQLALDLIYNKRLTSWWDVSETSVLTTLSTILIMNLIEKTTGAPHAIFHFQTTYNYLQSSYGTVSKIRK